MLSPFWTNALRRKYSSWKKYNVGQHATGQVSLPWSIDLVGEPLNKDGQMRVCAVFFFTKLFMSLWQNPFLITYSYLIEYPGTVTQWSSVSFKHLGTTISTPFFHWPSSSGMPFLNLLVTCFGIPDYLVPHVWWRYLVLLQEGNNQGGHSNLW